LGVKKEETSQKKPKPRRDPPTARLTSGGSTKSRPVGPCKKQKTKFFRFTPLGRFASQDTVKDREGEGRAAIRKNARKKKAIGTEGRTKLQKFCINQLNHDSITTCTVRREKLRVNPDDRGKRRKRSGMRGGKKTKPGEKKNSTTIPLHYKKVLGLPVIGSTVRKWQKGDRVKGGTRIYREVLGKADLVGVDGLGDPHKLGSENRVVTREKKQKKKKKKHLKKKKEKKKKKKKSAIHF